MISKTYPRANTRALFSAALAGSALGLGLAAAYLAGHDHSMALALDANKTIAKDKTVPDSLRARARQMAGLLGYDSVDDTTDAGGQTSH